MLPVQAAETKKPPERTIVEVLEEITPEDVTRFQSEILCWGRVHYVDFPWRSTRNLYHAIAAEVMLQRTNAEAVLPVYEQFVRSFPTPESFLAAPDVSIFESLGLAWRDREFRRLSNELASGEVSLAYDELLNLPGVGPYIAGAISSFHLGQRARIIDSNIVRLYGRYFGFATNAETRRDRAFIILSDRLTPDDTHRAYNYALLDFTRGVCRPRPRCEQCVLRDDCRSTGEGAQR